MSDHVMVKTLGTQTITVNSTEENLSENVLVLGILWGGFFIATCTTGWHVFTSWKVAEGEGTSSGDTSRYLFYKLLFIALLSRTIFIPLQIWSDGDMIQLIGDTLPELCFASAWALLVTFFVQLVGTATGTVSSNKPSLIIHGACYIMYVILVITYWWKDAAAVLLYALLCCLYAALFGALVYFGPKLIALLEPSLERQSGLAVRLIACCGIGVTVFLLQAIELARKVVAPPLHSLWWYNYGVLELLPSVLILIMMQPSPPKPTAEPPSQSQAGRETTALLKPSAQYGAKEGP